MNRLGEISTLYEIQQEPHATVTEGEDGLDEALKEVSKETEVIDIDSSE